MSSTVRAAVIGVAALAVTCVVAGGPRDARAGDSCVYEGTKYSDGAASCQAGVRYKCDDGEWKSKKEPCTGAVEKQDTLSGRTVIKKKKTEVEEEGD